MTKGELVKFLKPSNDEIEINIVNTTAAIREFYITYGISEGRLYPIVK